MANFWLRLWLYWFIFSNAVALISAAIIYLLAYAFLYFSYDNSLSEAINTLAIFSAKIGWAAGYLVGLLIVLKRLFGKNFSGYSIQMYDCKLENPLEEVFVSDTLRLWRKWLVRIAWSFIIIIMFMVMLHFAGIEGLIGWINIYSIWFFVSTFGGWILILTVSKCPRVKVVKRNSN